MTKIIGVRFKPVGKMYYFDPLDFDIKRGDCVIVETSRGTEYGEVVAGIREVEEKDVVKPLKSVLRLATEEDKLHYEENKRKEKEAYNICLEKIEKHGLDMKLIEVEYAFDGKKILFYFTADGRVDFRELVKDLAAVFRTRIELRQIGVRDESKTLGSIGICGRDLCCSQFLGEFVPVSIKMAKEQGLSLNPTKISGSCGRLMCCLKYEQDTYEQLISESPKAGAEIDTPDGRGTVVSVALLRGKVRVRFDNDGEVSIKDFDVDVLNGKVREPEPDPYIAVPRLITQEISDEPEQQKKPKPRHKRQNPPKRQKKNRENGIAEAKAPESSAHVREPGQERGEKPKRGGFNRNRSGKRHQPQQKQRESKQRSNPAPEDI